MDLENLKIDIISISSLLGRRICIDNLWLVDLGCPHIQPMKREKNVSTVYIFLYQGKVLKVGKADINSPARYNSHHYTPSGSKSSLYNSLKNSSEYMAIIGDDHIGDWIKSNCRRVDVHINGNEDSFTLGMIESILIYKLRPEFESKVTRK